MLKLNKMERAVLWLRDLEQGLVARIVITHLLEKLWALCESLMRFNSLSAIYSSMLVPNVCC